MNLPLLACTTPELEQRFERLGGKPFHARIARTELLKNGVLEYAAMSALPSRLRARLEAELPLLASREVTRTHAADGAVKLLLAMEPGEGRAAARAAGVETVFIPSHQAKQGKGATVCVSTQVGCPVGCPFCASGKLGLERNLQAHEIAEQFARARSLGVLSRAVVMGMGEPLLNFENLARAIEIVQSELELGARKITVSSVGFPERVRRAARANPRFQLAISLHSVDQAQRDELVPAMRGVPVEDVLAAGDDWFEATGREVTYEVVLLSGSNVSAEHARRLAQALRARRATVNLIPFNPLYDGAYRRPAPAEVERFRSLLEAAGVVTTVRWSRGLDSDAACGQLRQRVVG